MINRYERHTLIDWFDQKRLKDARVVVVGAGAIGNEVLKNLVLLGVGHLHVVDFDRIEEHNLTRAVLFRDADIGRDKATVAAEACRQLDPMVDMAASVGAAWNTLSLDELSMADAVVSCVDNFEARIDLNKLCLLANTDLYNAAIDSRSITVELFPFSEDTDCACYQCQLPGSVYDRLAQRYSCGWLRKVGLVERKVPTTAVTSSMAAAVVVSLLLNRLCDHPDRIDRAVRYFQDAVDLNVTLADVPRNPDCIACRFAHRGTVRTRAARHCAQDSLIPALEGEIGEIVLSEPILTTSECRRCGRIQDYYKSTREVTDAVTQCTQCGTQSVALKIVDVVSLAEFKGLFSGRDVPCKFLTYGSDGSHFVIELEDST